MTIEEAKRRAELYSALAEGKTIQVLIKDDEWKDIKIDELKHLQDYYKYRIKPEPKYRPFETKEECWNEMLKHQPFGWVVNNRDYLCLISINKHIEEKDFSYMFRDYTFIDSLPFGIKEE